VTATPAAVVLNGSVTVTGQNFTPNKTATVTYSLNGTFRHTYYASIGCNGSFTLSFIPGTAVTDIGTGKVVATDSSGRSNQATFTIVA
jgi:hypothetical protein